MPFDEPLFTAEVGSVLDPASPLLRLAAASFVTPATVYDLDLASRELLLRKRTPVLGGFYVRRLRAAPRVGRGRRRHPGADLGGLPRRHAA